MKRLLLFFLITIFVVSMASVGLGAKEKVVIGLVHLGTTHPYHMGELAGAREAARRYDAELIIRTGEYNIEKQVAAAEDLIQQKLDAITILPLSYAAFFPTFKKVEEKGILLIALNTYSYIEEAEVVVRYDEFVNSGKVAEYTVKLLEERYGAPRGQVALIGGSLGQDAHDFRVRGFTNVMKKYPNIEVVAVTPADWDVKKTTDVMENYIVAYPNLDVVYGMCDEQAVACANVIRRAGKSDQIMVVGLGGTQLDPIEDGRVRCTLLLGLGPEYAGFIPQKIAIDIARGKKVPKLFEISGPIITQDNVDGLIRLRKDIKSDITKINFENPEEVLKEYGIE